MTSSLDVQTAHPSAKTFSSRTRVSSSSRASPPRCAPRTRAGWARRPVESAQAAGAIASCSDHPMRVVAITERLQLWTGACKHGDGERAGAERMRARGGGEGGWRKTKGVRTRNNAPRRRDCAYARSIGRCATAFFASLGGAYGVLELDRNRAVPFHRRLPPRRAPCRAPFAPRPNSRGRRKMRRSRTCTSATSLRRRSSQRRTTHLQNSPRAGNSPRFVPSSLPCNPRYVLRGQCRAGSPSQGSTCHAVDGPRSGGRNESHPERCPPPPLSPLPLGPRCPSLPSRSRGTPGDSADAGCIHGAIGCNSVVVHRMQPSLRRDLRYCAD